MTTPAKLPPLVDDNWRVANEAFWHLPKNPIVCTTLSDDINWRFFGMEIREYPCDDSDEYYQCWTSAHLVTGPH